MNVRPWLSLILGSGLLSAQGSLSQMPSQPGTLEIRSEPTGASVTINDQLVGTPTNATLVISPGKYTVSVGTKGATPYCGPQSVTVQSNETQVLVCSGTRWTS
jgi:hypothetical protein